MKESEFNANNRGFTFATPKQRVTPTVKKKNNFKVKTLIKIIIILVCIEVARTILF